MSVPRGRGGPRPPRRRGLLLALLAGVAATAVAVAILVDGSSSSTSQPPRPKIPSAPAGSGRQLFIASRGADSNPGTRQAPWRTIAKALRVARPGDTVVLRAGTYGARGITTTIDTSGTPTAPITFRGGAGEPRPKLLGHLKITGSHLRFSGLLFDGPTGQVKEIDAENPKGEEVQVAIEGDNVQVLSSEIRGSDWHAGIFLSGADDVSIVGNYIHDNGDDGSCCYELQENASHGIYFSSGSGLIANNVIEHNLARGVQLYEGPQHVIVTQNTIVHNGRAGVQVANDTANSTVANNIVAYNGDIGIRSDSLSGSGNVAINNLAWHNSNGSIGLEADGLKLVDNIEAAPHFVSTTDYRLRSGSSAVDAADPSLAVGYDYDRVRRPQGAAPDIGAFEAR